MVDKDEAAVFSDDSNNCQDANNNYNRWHNDHPIEDLMFDSLITVEDVLVHKDINSDPCEDDSNYEHDKGPNTGETLENIEHKAIRKDWRLKRNEYFSQVNLIQLIYNQSMY